MALLALETIMDMYNHHENDGKDIQTQQECFSALKTLFINTTSTMAQIKILRGMLHCLSIVREPVLITAIGATTECILLCVMTEKLNPHHIFALFRRYNVIKGLNRVTTPETALVIGMFLMHLYTSCLSPYDMFPLFYSTDILILCTDIFNHMDLDQDHPRNIATTLIQIIELFLDNSTVNYQAVTRVITPVVLQQFVEQSLLVGSPSIITMIIMHMIKFAIKQSHINIHKVAYWPRIIMTFFDHSEDTQTLFDLVFIITVILDFDIPEVDSVLQPIIAVIIVNALCSVTPGLHAHRLIRLVRMAIRRDWITDNSYLFNLISSWPCCFDTDTQAATQYCITLVDWCARANSKFDTTLSPHMITSNLRAHASKNALHKLEYNCVYTRLDDKCRYVLLCSAENFAEYTRNPDTAFLF